jgi:hypothetical protein
MNAGQRELFKNPLLIVKGEAGTGTAYIFPFQLGPFPFRIAARPTLSFSVPVM